MLNKTIVAELLVYSTVTQEEIQEHLESVCGHKCETEEEAAKHIVHEKLNVSGGSLKNWSYYMHPKSN